MVALYGLKLGEKDDHQIKRALTVACMANNEIKLNEKKSKNSVESFEAVIQHVSSFFLVSTTHRAERTVQIF